MPHIILKRVWDYCSYSKKYLVFIMVLLFISSLIQNYVIIHGDSNEINILHLLVLIVVSGYGMVITKDRINHGNRLPKIVVKDILLFGIKSAVVISVYVFVQGKILDYICSPLNFPRFDLEEMLLNWSETIHMLYSHNPVNTVIFLVVGAILFYVCSFFMEIALARLADTGSLVSSFNFIAIKRSIDAVGWRNYAKDYTLIVFVIVFLSYLMSYEFAFSFLDSIVDMFLAFLIFATQYLGIGAAYCEIKDLETKVRIPVE
jgi:hypothetical protein